MMNQSEIDAGPPNKKAKIGNVGTNVNGHLSTQVSESTGLFYNFIYS